MAAGDGGGSAGAAHAVSPITVPSTMAMCRPAVIALLLVVEPGLPRDDTCAQAKMHLRPLFAAGILVGVQIEAMESAPNPNSAKRGTRTSSGAGRVTFLSMLGTPDNRLVWPLRAVESFRLKCCGRAICFE